MCEKRKDRQHPRKGPLASFHLNVRTFRSTSHGSRFDTSPEGKRNRIHRFRDFFILESPQILDEPLGNLIKSEHCQINLIRILKIFLKYSLSHVGAFYCVFCQDTLWLAYFKLKFVIQISSHIGCSISECPIFSWLSD